MADLELGIDEFEGVLVGRSGILISGVVGCRRGVCRAPGDASIATVGKNELVAGGLKLCARGNSTQLFSSHREGRTAILVEPGDPRALAPQRSSYCARSSVTVKSLLRHAKKP